MRTLLSSLRFRLILLVLLAVLPALGLILRTNLEQRQWAVAEAQEEALQLARLAAVDQEQFIQSAQQLLAALAQLPAVRDGDPTACETLLANLLEQYPVYTGFTAASPQGDVFCSAPPIAGTVNFSDRTWYQRLVQTKNFVAGEYQMGRISGKPTLVLAYPALDAAGSLQAIVTAGLDLDELNQVVAEAQLPAGSAFIVLDHGGTILARQPDPKTWVGQSVPETPLIQAVLAQGEGALKGDGVDGVLRLYSFASLASAPAGEAATYVGVGIPVEIVLARAERTLVRNLALLGAVLVLALAAAWAGSELFFLRRMRTLLGATRRLAAGHLEARTELRHDQGEIGQLAQAFDRMAEALEGREAERSRAEKRLRRVNRTLRLLSDCNQIVIRATEERGLLHDVCRLVVGVGGYRLAWIGFAERDEGKTVRPVAQAGFEEGYLEMVTITWAEDERGQGPTGTAIRTGQPGICRNILTDPSFASWRDEATERGYAAYIALPLLGEGEAFGSLNVYAADPDAFDEEEVGLLTEMAGDLAFGITALRTRAERDRAQQELRRERDFAESLIETAQAIVLVLDTEGRIVRFNPYMEEISGYRLEEVLGQDWFSTFLPGRNHRRIRALFSKAVRDIQTRGNVNPIVTKDGQERAIEWYDKTLKDAEGKVVGLLAIGQDVTERVQAEEALRESEERYRSTLDNMMEGCQIIDFDWRYLYVNDAVARHGRQTKEDLLGHTMMAVYPGIEETEMFAWLRRCMEERVPHQMENQFTYPDGAQAWFELSIEPVPEGIFILSIDITERVRAEEERERLLLAEREQRLLAETLREVAVALNTSLELQEVLSLILKHLSLVVACDSAAVILVSDGTPQVGAQWSASARRKPSTLPQIEHLPHMHQVLEGRRPVIIPDTATDERWVRLPGSEQVQCWLGVPLVVQNEAIGLLSLNQSQAGFYTPDHAELAVAVANQAATAIQNARLFEETRRRAALQEALNAVIGAAAAASDLPALLETVLDHILQALGLEAGIIWTGDQVLTRDFPPEIGDAHRQMAQATALDIPGSVAVDDWQQVTAASPVAALKPRTIDAGVRASLTVPILTEERRIGGLSLASSEPRRWLAEEVALVEAVGQQLGGAVVRLRLLEKIQEQAQTVQQIVRTVPEGVLLLDGDLHLLLTNPLAEEYLAALTDTRPGEILTRLGDRPIVELLTSPPQRGLWHEVATDGRSFEVLARPMENGPETKRWVLVVRDVTREREVQQRVQRQERLAAVGQLAAGIAHDFNNIMAVIVLYAGTSLRTLDLPSRLRERLVTISQQAKRATRLIQQILDFSRRAVMERQPLDLVPFLKEQVKLLERTIPENVSINLSHGGEEYAVMADPTRLQQAVMNLALNARDAMPEGGDLHIGLARVRVEDRKQAPLPEMAPGEWVRVTVADSGVGISPKDLPRVFEPFFTTKAPGQGTGLGLAQVYGIVKQHEGYIDVVSQVGEGTTFTLYLPALPVSPPEAIEPEDLELVRGRGETILVVEDDAATREALVESLGILDYQVLEAANGREALAILEQAGDDPSIDPVQRIALVVTDVVMPEMGGRALLYALREKGLMVPVVMLTGHPLEEELEGLRSQGLSAWLPKPPSVEQLAQAVARALKEDQGRL
jgi:PAS domain S-box-containing protein